MNQNERYLSAKEMYAKIGVDTEAALAKMQNIRISMHCWQADDVHGFEGMGALTGKAEDHLDIGQRAAGPDARVIPGVPGQHGVDAIKEAVARQECLGAAGFFSRRAEIDHRAGKLADGRPGPGIGNVLKILHKKAE